MKLGLVAAQMEINHQALMAVAREIGAALGIEDEITALAAPPPRVRQAEVGMIQQQQLVLSLLQRVRESLIVPEVRRGNVAMDEDALFTMVTANEAVMARIRDQDAIIQNDQESGEANDQGHGNQEPAETDDKPKRKAKA